jgi:hypothetical protein
VHVVPPSPPQLDSQLPPTQLSPEGQALPHTPQLAGSERTSLHPVAQHDSPPVQSGPPLHVFGGGGVVHAEFTHVAPLGQTIAHPPQLFGSVAVEAHPVVQQVCPTEQLHTGGAPQLVPEQHCPSRHWVDPAGQARPHPPQLFRSLVVSVHPAVQQLSPFTQLQMGGVVQPCDVQHRLSWHPKVPTGHTRPHPPQLLTSLVVSVQFPLQHESLCAHGPHAGGGGGKLSRHAPLMHVWSAWQTMPHAPQLLGSLVVSVQPLAQQSWLNGQPLDAQLALGPTHVPLMHELPVAQTSPQAPQLKGSVRTFAEQFASPPESLPPSSITQTCDDGSHVAPPAQSSLVTHWDPSGRPSSPWRDDREQPAKITPRNTSTTANGRARDRVIRALLEGGGREAYTQHVP